MNKLFLVKNVRGYVYFIFFIYYEFWEDLDIGSGCNFRVIIVWWQFFFLYRLNKGVLEGFGGEEVGVEFQKILELNDYFLISLGNSMFRGDLNSQNFFLVFLRLKMNSRRIWGSLYICWLVF